MVLTVLCCKDESNYVYKDKYVVMKQLAIYSTIILTICIMQTVTNKPLLGKYVQKKLLANLWQTCYINKPCLFNLVIPITSTLTVIIIIEPDSLICSDKRHNIMSIQFCTCTCLLIQYSSSNCKLINTSAMASCSSCSAVNVEPHFHNSIAN